MQTTVYIASSDHNFLINILLILWEFHTLYFDQIDPTVSILNSSQNHPYVPSSPISHYFFLPFFLLSSFPLSPPSFFNNLLTPICAVCLHQGVGYLLECDKNVRSHILQENWLSHRRHHNRIKFHSKMKKKVHHIYPSQFELLQHRCHILVA